MDKSEEIVQLLKSYNQEHIVKLLNKLEGKQKEELIEQIKNMGIKPSDTVIIHSSMKSIGDVEGGADTVID